MSKIINERFEEWTKDLPEEEARINIFEKIRDIPYAVISEHFDPEKGPELMLAENRGFCVPKHYLLGSLYARLGIEIRYHTYAFKWEELDIAYTGSIRSLAAGMPETYHLACKALIGSKWVLVDATWDRSIKDTGLPVNDKWDGRSDTVLAVKPLDEFVHNSVAEREKFLEEKLKKYGLPDKLQLSRFAIEFNKWLEGTRITGEGSNNQILT